MPGLIRFWRERRYRRSAFEVKDIDNLEIPGVKQHDMAADQYMGTIRRRRWKLALQLIRAAVILLAQTRRKRTPPYQLPFQSGRKPVAFGQSRRQVILVIVMPIPAAKFVAIMIAIPVAIPVTIVVIVIAMMFAVSVAVPVSLRVGQAA